MLLYLARHLRVSNYFSLSSVTVSLSTTLHPSVQNMQAAAVIDQHIISLRLPKTKSKDNTQILQTEPACAVLLFTPVNVW